jgi:transcriptional antiterminator NusG
MTDMDTEDTAGAVHLTGLERLEQKQWYVVHTFTGYENKVKAALERRARSLHLEDKLGRILVLTEEEIRGGRRGKKQVRKHKIFPGYVIMEMELDDQVRHLVRTTPGVTGFVGPGRHPVPLSPEEVGRILGTAEGEGERVRVALSVDQTVRITAGPFEGFHGRIQEVNVAKQKLRVLVSIFGRDTPVELDFGDVERLE